MSSPNFLASLNLGTLILVVVIVGIGFAWFLRRRSNRHSMDGRQERNVGRDIDAGRDARDHSPRK